MKLIRILRTLFCKCLGMLLIIIVASSVQTYAQNDDTALADMYENQDLNEMKVGEESAVASKLKSVVTLKKGAQNLITALESIARQADLNLSYSKQFIPLDKKVVIKKTEATAERALWHVLEDTPFRFGISASGQLVLLKMQQPESKEGLQETVTGNVIDAQSGETLPGVNVLVKGTTTGTSTDGEGAFELTVPSLEDTLVVSFVGYQTQEVPLNGRTEIDIQLSPEAIMGEEMVVVGYGVQEQINVTGSVSSINYEEDLANRPITNSSQALSGNASGIWVSQNSGKPGSDAAQIRIRGWGTMNNSDPLVIIDGVEGSFSQLNPSDIESVSVLKDAASAAIYGSRAANGVVLITTKEGQYDQDLQISLSSYGGIQQLGRRYDMVNNSADHMELYNQALANEGSDPLYSNDLVSNFRNGDNPHLYPNTNWYDEIFRTASIQEHNVSISGGSSQIAAYFSLNYLEQDGILKNTNSDRYGLRANIETQPTEWIDLGLRLNYKKQDSNEPYEIGRTWDMLHEAVPFIAPYTEDGRFGSVQAFDEDGNLLYDNRNPLIDNHNGGTESEEEITNLQINAQLDFTENLSLNTTFASKGTWNMSSHWNEWLYGYTSTGIQTITRNYAREGIERIRNHNKIIENSLYSTFNYNKSFAEIHDVTILAGIEYQSNTIKDVRARSINPPKGNLTQVDAGTGGYTANGNLSGLRTFSYFGRVNYSLANKYLFEANLRRDGSSRFSEDNRWGTFPGFSAGWRLGEEEFVQNLNIFSSLKLRASWGRLGNQNIVGYWPYLTVINQNNGLSYSYNENFVPGAAVTSLTDENITWESATTRDIGLDIGFLDNRINIEATYFNKITEDIIVQLPIPQTLGGVSPPYENEGKMENKGLELVFGYDIPAQDRNQLGASINANLTYTKNEVTKFREGDSPDQLYLIREGHSFNSLYGYKVEGIYQTDTEAEEHMHASSLTPEAGNLRYEDTNDDGRLNFQDKQVLGNTIPKWTFGLSPTFNYKGFNLKMLFQGSADLSVYTQGPPLTVASNVASIHSMWRDAWTPQNTDTSIPSIKLSNTWDTQQSDFWIHDISFIKLKNIQLGYTLPNSTLSRLGVQDLYIYANGQNVFTIVDDDYPGYDPERNTFDSGEDIYPTPRIFTIGFNLQF